ncbi:hypothetical protein IJ579_03360, partial [bacterium]|nr:hypothetical protein [bacterium]
MKRKSGLHFGISRLGLLHVKFPHPQYHLSGNKCRLGLLPQHIKFPSLARTLPSKQSGELFARGKVGMGLFPARGKRTAIETTPSLFVTLAEPTSLRVVRDCVHGSEASRRGSQRWRAGETYAGGRGFR